MGYILKNTQGLLSTRLTDTARLKLSQGSFNISYFQVGDSEVSYNSLPGSYNQFLNLRLTLKIQQVNLNLTNKMLNIHIMLTE